MNDPRPTRPFNPRTLALGHVIRHDGRDLTVDRISLEADAVDVGGRPVERPKGRRVTARYTGDAKVDLVATDDDIAAIRNDLHTYLDRRVKVEEGEPDVSSEVLADSLVLHVDEWTVTVLRTPPAPAADDEEPF